MKPPISFSQAIPEGEDRLRRVCDTCGFIDYVNPRVVVGAVVHRNGQILLCKRAINPRKGLWTLPAGFLEEGESVEDGCLREAREEANAELEIEALLAVYSVPRISQVQIFYRARLLNDPSPGPESEAVALYDWDAIPWSELAFPSVKWSLDGYRATKDQRAFAPIGNPPGTEAMTRGTSPR